MPLVTMKFDATWHPAYIPRRTRALNMLRDRADGSDL